MTANVPLFVPLKGEFYDAFANGTKFDELRRYGPRWNERTCRIGREVILSRGYGRRQRLRGRIWYFKKQHGTLFGSGYRASIQRLYGTLDIDIAVISIDLRKQVVAKDGSGTEPADDPNVPAAETES